jgi:TolB protein
MPASTPARSCARTGLLLCLCGLVGGCVGPQPDRAGSTSLAAAPAPDPAPVADDLLLFGDRSSWASPMSLPADPIPLTGAPDSVDVTRITASEQGADFDPVVSADGRFLVFASTQHSVNADIYLKRVGSKVITQLTDDPGRDVMPAISPDGEWIAFASDRQGSWNIYVMPRSGGRPVQVTSSPAAELHPSFSPDGSLLAYSKLGEGSGKWEMWVTEVANSATPHFIGYGLFPEWCPTPGTGPNGGDLLVYQRSSERGDRAFGIWTLEYRDGDVGSPSQLAGNARSAYINPTWSPDGRFVVFAAVPRPSAVQTVEGIRRGPSDLWMVSADGSVRVSLTGGSATDLMPTWGRDGRIYFVSSRTGRDNIWALDAGQALAAAGLAPAQPLATVPEGSDGASEGP